jgi:hypothetical protein
MKNKIILLTILSVIVLLFFIKTNQITGFILFDKDYVPTPGSNLLTVYGERPIANRQVYIISINPFTMSDIDNLDDYFYQRTVVYNDELRIKLELIKSIDKSSLHSLDNLDAIASKSLNSLINHWCAYSTRTDINGHFSVSVPAGKYLILVIVPANRLLTKTEPIGELKHESKSVLAFQNSSTEFIIDPRVLK